MLILAWGSNQFQYIERGASESQYFSLFLRRVGSPKVEFDDTSNVIWGVRKWQYHRRGVSKIYNLSVALARVKVFRYSYVAWESIFSFLQHPPRNIDIFSGTHLTDSVDSAETTQNRQARPSGTRAPGVRMT